MWFYCWVRTWVIHFKFLFSKLVAREWKFIEEFNLFFFWEKKPLLPPFCVQIHLAPIISKVFVDSYHRRRISKNHIFSSKTLKKFKSKNAKRCLGFDASKLFFLQKTVKKMSPYFLASRILKFDSLLKILQEKRNLEFFEQGHFRYQWFFLINISPIHFEHLTMLKDDRNLL